jgi:hypothetical protein
VLSAVVVAAVVLAVVFTRPGGGGSSAQGGEVFLQAAGSAGQDPFTESTARQSSAPPPPSATAGHTGQANVVRAVQGGAPGLYGGTRHVAACDVDKQAKVLRDDRAKNRAFASVAGVDPAGVPGYLRSLTPVQLRVDTRVTSHGYRGRAATSYQAVLQAGTAVLVDAHGVPRVRCVCGNPLTPPVAQRTAPRLVGERWPAYQPSNVVVVTPAPTAVGSFVLYDPRHDDWFHRHRGDETGRQDQHASPPAEAHPWTTPVPCPPGTPGSPGCPPASGGPSKSASPSSSPASPGSRPPSSPAPSASPSGGSSSTQPSPESPSSGAESPSSGASGSASTPPPASRPPSSSGPGPSVTGSPAG